MSKAVLELNELQDNYDLLTVEEIFKKIGELDKKYIDDQNYCINVDGAISNIGHLKNDTKLISFSIKRIKQKLKEDKIPKSLLDKLYYDLALSITDKEEIIVGYPAPMEKIINCEAYREASKIYANIPRNSKSYPKAMSNLSNILDKYSRVYESILLYDKVLEVFPNFGMALGNKALAIVYYYKLTKRNPELLIKAIELLENAIKQGNTIVVGGPHIIEYMKRELSDLKAKVNEHEIKQVLDLNNKLNDLTEEQKFYKKNKLFINLCYECNLCEKCISDNLIPKYVIKANDVNLDEIQKFSGFPKKIFFSFTMINQIFEDFSVARKLIWFYVHENSEYTDIKTNYIQIADNVKNELKFGYLKTSFSKLYNILDKIAYLIFFYFDEYQSRVYFDNIHCIKIKEAIITSKNNQFLALYSLSNDFNEGGIYNNLRLLRNKIIHSYLNFSDKPESEYDIREIDFYNETLQLFGIVKAALVYFTISIDFEGQQYDDKFIQSKLYYFQKEYSK